MQKRLKRKRKKQKKMIILSTILLSFTLITAYSAFSTKLNITAKGNIKDLKKEVDSKVPTNELLFWGEADNRENTITLLKDKSGNNNDGILNNFDNTLSSGYNDDGLVFDGINDYVNIGFANYDFKNSISYVVYVKIVPSADAYNNCIFGNWESAGSGLFFYKTKNSITYSIHSGDENAGYIVLSSTETVNSNNYYSIIGTYDGTNANLYIDGKLVKNTAVPYLPSSPVSIFLGANSEPTTTPIEFANMSLKEAMLYDRALTDEEIKTITEGFQKKYK